MKYILIIQNAYYLKYKTGAQQPLFDYLAGKDRTVISGNQVKQFKAEVVDKIREVNTNLPDDQQLSANWVPVAGSNESPDLKLTLQVPVTISGQANGKTISMPLQMSNGVEVKLYAIKP